MATVTADKLLKVLETGNEKACLKFFERATEEERKAVSATAIAFLKEVSKNMFIESRPGTFRRNERMPVAQLALLASASFSEITAAKWRGIPTSDEDAFQVLKARRPKWLPDYALWLLKENAGHWPIVRQMVRKGLCDPPQHDNYILGMIHTVCGWTIDPFIGLKKKGVAAYLRRDPELLRNEMWRLFEIEGAGELTLAASDKYISKKGSELSWSGGLIELSREGKLSRERLLDASLAALNRGFSQFRVAWFSQFHELLKPTIAERVARQQQYLDLLASPIPPTVTFALDALDLIDAQSPIDSAMVLASLPPVLLAKHKGTAKRGVLWLARLVERDSSCRGEVPRVAAQALGHEAVEVQKAALDILDKYGDRHDDETRDRVGQLKTGIAASLRPRLQQWLAGDKTDASHARKLTMTSAKGAEVRDDDQAIPKLAKEAAKVDKKWRTLTGIDRILTAWKEGKVDVAAMQFDVFDIPQLADETHVLPIADLDELIDVCSQFIEDPGNIELGERAFDGLSRLCDQRPDDFDRRVGPLLLRVQKNTKGLWKPLTRGGLCDDLHDLILAWTSGKPPKVVNKLLARQARSYELAQRVAKRITRPLLSAPTHRGGWIDPLAIAERLKTWNKLGDTPPIYDACFALLRLAPEGRKQALGQIAKCNSEVADAFRHALGAEGVKIGSHRALWASAARARHPYRDDERVQQKLGDLGPDGAVAAKYASRWTIRGSGAYRFFDFHLEVTPRIPKSANGIPTVELLSVSRRIGHGDLDWTARWLGYVWPAGREAYFAVGCQALGQNLDWWEAAWSNKILLEPLLDANCPLGEVGRLLLCIGLFAKEPGEHGLATDALVAAIQDGRVDAQRLASPLIHFLQSGGVKPTRLAKALSIVARQSPLHSLVVRELLEAIMVQMLGTKKQVPKDLPQLLELLHELLAEAEESLSIPMLRELLAAQTGSGKLAQTAKAIVDLPERMNPAFRSTVVATALEVRVQRARKWAEAQSGKGY